MSKKKGYYFDLTPRWLKYSGLPKELNKKYGELAWSIFHCLIQLDCRYNPDYPNTFDQLFEEIADLTGITRRTVSKYIETFEKDKLITVKRGVRGKKSTFKLANPIKTPKTP
jgi:DNA-binding MarR family transcriptional regulator